MGIQLIMFGGENCRITEMMIPVVRQLQQRLRAESRAINIRYVNASRSPVLNGKWGVRVTPTFFVTDEGPPPTGGPERIYARMQGTVSLEALYQVLVSLDGAWRGVPIPR